MRARIGRWSLAAAGVLVGVLLLGPVSAHVNNSFSHLWNEHIKPKADDRYVNENEDVWARIKGSDGTIVEGEGVSSSSRDGTGDYIVAFNRNIRRCAQVVTTRGANLIPSTDNVINTAATEVVLQNTLNNPVDADFSIMVHC